MNNKKRMLVILIPILLSFFGVAHAEPGDINPENPIYGTGKILLLEDDGYLWIKITGDEKDSVTSKFTNGMYPDNYRKKIRAVRIKLLGINNSISGYKRLESEESFVDKMNSVLNSSSKGRDLDFSCYSTNTKFIPVCELSIGDININKVFIREGYAKLEKNAGFNPNENDYIAAEKLAKHEKIGIWAPFYNMFSF